MLGENAILNLYREQVKRWIIINNHRGAGHFCLLNNRTVVGGMLYERTVLSKKPAKLAEMELAQLRAEDKLTPDLVFRDPYFLDFLGLRGAYSEKDLETAILRELEAFLVELGGDFAFLAPAKAHRGGRGGFLP